VSEKPVCQILRISREGVQRWHWRHVAPGGHVFESAETYAFHYECVTAARMSGYEPEMKWLEAT